MSLIDIYGTKSPYTTGTPKQVPGYYTPNPTVQTATAAPAKTYMSLPEMGIPQTATVSTGKTYLNTPEMGIPATATVRQTAAAPASVDIPTASPQTASVPGLQTQYATPDNTAAYKSAFNFQEDPGYQFVLNQGLNAINSRNAARGLLGSSANQQNIADYVTGLAAQQYQNAWDRNRTENLDALGAFTGDRGYMTDQYWNTRNANFNEADRTNQWNYGMYQDEQKAYQDMLTKYYQQLLGISQTGQGAANASGDIQSWLGTNLAQLYGNLGNVNASATQAQGSNNSDMLMTLIGLGAMLL